MDAELVGIVTVSALVVAGVWTVWSANKGRRAARWGRRQLRRGIALLLLATTAALLAV